MVSKLPILIFIYRDSNRSVLHKTLSKTAQATISDTKCQKSIQSKLNPVRPDRKTKLNKMKSGENTPVDSADESSEAHPRLRVLKSADGTPIDSADERAVPIPKLVKKSRQSAPTKSVELEVIKQDSKKHVNKQKSAVASSADTMNEVVNKQLHMSADQPEGVQKKVALASPHHKVVKAVVNEQTSKSADSTGENVNKQLPISADNSDTVEVVNEDQSKWSRSKSYAHAIDI